jgi:hypothetical protein
MKLACPDDMIVAVIGVAETQCLECLVHGDTRLYVNKTISNAVSDSTDPTFSELFALWHTNPTDKWVPRGYKFSSIILWR